MRVLRLPCAAVLVVFTAAVPAKDYVLTIGGGYAPDGNQVSLEKNVLFFERVLEAVKPEGVEHTILFADGDDPRRDVVYLDPDAEVPRVDDLLARVFKETDHFDELYRNHAIPNVSGAATRDNVRDWFRETAGKLASGDRVLVYVTAHGGRGENKDKPRNTRLHLWDGEDLTVEELTTELDRIPAEVPTVVVMVQCFSGGFADFVFDGADEKKGPTRHDRCGFFATTYTRVAAGCTPDIDEEDYREYSSAFWAAVLGQTRTGGPVEKADYDCDSTISFAEAHAYVLITSDTIDVPLKTSDAFLRAYAGENAKRPPVVASREGSGAKTVTALRPAEPLTADSPVEALVAAADPVEKAVITGLSERLGLTRPDRAAEARDEAKRIENERRNLSRRSSRLGKRVEECRAEIETEVLAEWPELAGPWNPAGRKIVADQPDAIVELIESHPRYAEWDRLTDETADIEDRRLDLERRWAKCQRLIRTLESVALAHKLTTAGDPELASRYERLRASEAKPFEDH